MSPYPIGARVRIVGGPEGVITEILDHLDPPSYKIFISGTATPIVSQPDLEAVDTVDSDLGALLRNGWSASPEAFRFAVTHRKLADHLTDTLLAFNSARIQIQAHQFKPLLKLLDSPYRRLLIADEVGLGKTIEAGIVLSEFELRERLDTVAVVCPHALVFKWRDELDAKFGSRFEIWTPRQVQAWVNEAKANGEPHPARWIASLEGLRASGVATLLADAPLLINCLIIDEAHHLRNSETESFRLGESLSAAADIALFLSATPLNLRNRDLFNLVSLLLPDVYSDEETFEAQLGPNRLLNQAIRELRAGSAGTQTASALGQLYETSMSDVFRESSRFQGMLDRLAQTTPLSVEERVRFQRLCMELNTLDAVFTRTRKSDVTVFAVREAHSVSLSFSPAERSFYEAVTAFCLERYAETGGSGLGAVMYQRQLCSCIPAMRQLLVELGNAHAADWVSDDNDEGEEEAEVRALSGSEAALLAEALVAGEGVGEEDSKYLCFEGILERLLNAEGVKRIMTFSFFRRTIRYLERRLKGRYKVGVIMGGMSLEDREAVVDQFRRGDLQLLLASEVGGEGLDFQFCNVLVNYDLPWNPMKVEQRIGRLDRFGQKSDKILIYNLLVDDTVEARIFGRLFDRIEIFKSSIGDLEAILGETVSELTKDAMNLRLSPAQQAERAELLAQQIVHRQEDEAKLAGGKGALLSNDQFFLDRFDAIRRGKSYLTADEMANFCAEGFARHFPDCRITRSGRRWWLRPSVRFAEHVRRVVYDAGADGRMHHPSHVMRPLLKLRAASDAGQAIPVTFNAEEGFDDRQLELLSATHPYVQALVRKNSGEPLNTASVGRFQLSASSGLSEGTHLVAVYKLASTGLRAAVRLHAVAVDFASNRARMMDPDWLGQYLESFTAASTSITASGSNVTARLETADRALEERRREEAAQSADRQEDLLRMQIASLAYAFDRKRERLQSAINGIPNEKIRRLRRSELARAQVKHEEQLEELRGRSKSTVTYERIALALVTVS